VIQESLKLTISQFLKFIESGALPQRSSQFAKGAAATDYESTLEEFLDRIALHRHKVSFNFDPKDYPNPPRKPEGHYRRLVQKRFPHYGYYNSADIVTEAIAESEVVVGDAVADIEEIAHELHQVLWRWENNSQDDAIWYFNFSYSSHWGRHLRDLQLYLWNLKQGI
jgi:hypothetical protein